MKPKTRVFCSACHRHKMVFGTKKEAEMFMMYNGDDIKDEHGYRPIRAYYCGSCMGWHITSQEKISIDYDSVINIIRQFGNPVATFPTEEDCPDNNCVNKSRKKTYTAILGIRDTENKTPDTIEDDLFVGLAGVKGYLKLAKRESNPVFLYDAEACCSYICTLLLQTIYVNIDRLKNIVSDDDIAKEFINNTIISQTYTFTAVLHNFEQYVETSLELKSIVDDEAKRIHKKYQENMLRTRSERAVNKLNEHMNNIADSINNREYEQASKIIHFAVLLIQKVAEDKEIRDTLKMFIDKLIEYRTTVNEMLEN